MTENIIKFEIANTAEFLANKSHSSLETTNLTPVLYLQYLIKMNKPALAVLAIIT